MQKDHIKHLRCPSCYNSLSFLEISEEIEDRVKTGELGCEQCQQKYPVVRFIPRFVSSDNYAASFGHEWKEHARTQYDSNSGVDNTERRFFTETKWDRNLKGEFILEVGSGSGRFTEQAANTGAFVVSLDYSLAVEANYESHKDRDNVLIVQGNIYSMPFKRRFFDKVMCLGVIQHTPDPRKSFTSLAPFLKDGGRLAVDVYRRGTFTFNFGKYFARLFTKNSTDPEKLYKRCVKYVDFMWPLASLIRRIPKIGPTINWRLVVADYSRLGITGQTLKQWAYLDTFDMLSPRYDFPSTVNTVKSWFQKDGFAEIEVHKGYNGIEGRGVIHWDQ